MAGDRWHLYRATDLSGTSGSAIWRLPRVGGGDAQHVGDVPLSSVWGLAISPHGIVAGGVSPRADLFWDAWVVPPGGASPRRLAPIGNTLVAVDASGVLWTAITAVGPSGNATYEIRLSPTDGSPSVRLSPELPPHFAAYQAVADGEGGRLLIGSELFDDDGETHGAVFAVEASGRARRLACDPRPDSAVVMTAALAPDALYLAVQDSPDRPSMIVKVARR
jgi:hypothetical protein